MAQKPRQSSGVSRGSQWESLLRKFSRAHRVECKSVSVHIPRIHRSTKHYPSGSKYEGEWNVLGMSGEGVYTLPNGVIYKGEFEDGQFHGKGELQYPSGVVLKGKWLHGEMVERRLFFDDGLEYSEVDWKYCKMPDRRFTIEYNKGLQPYDRTFMTADQPTRPVPEGFFDTGDGFYCPKTKMVYHANDLTAIIRAPMKTEQKWIVENCRKNPIETVGPRPDLYEGWQKPNIDSRDTPEPAVISRRSTLPYSKNQREFEQEIKKPGPSDDKFKSAESPMRRFLWYRRPSITFDPTLPPGPEEEKDKLLKRLTDIKSMLDYKEDEEVRRNVTSLSFQDDEDTTNSISLVF